MSVEGRTEKNSAQADGFRSSRHQKRTLVYQTYVTRIECYGMSLAMCFYPLSRRSIAISIRLKNTNIQTSILYVIASARENRCKRLVFIPAFSPCDPPRAVSWPSRQTGSGWNQSVEDVSWVQAGEPALSLFEHPSRGLASGLSPEVRAGIDGRVIWDDDPHRDTVAHQGGNDG